MNEKQSKNISKEKATGKPETVAGVLKSAIQAGTKRGSNRPRPKPQVKLSKGDVLKTYYKNRRNHYLYGVVSFVMTALFYMTFTSPEFVQVIAGGLVEDSTAGFSKAAGAAIWAIVGLFFSVVITLLILQAHTAETTGTRIINYIFLVGLCIAFNVFTEVSSTADRVSERVKVKSEDSAVFKALTGSIKNASGTSNQA
jgi:hypothetical protein